MGNVRAKFRCEEIKKRIGYVEYTFLAVCADEVPENQRFHKWTPSGKLEIVVTNPAVSYELGQPYYLDFTPAFAPEAASHDAGEPPVGTVDSTDSESNPSAGTADTVGNCLGEQEKQSGTQLDGNSPSPSIPTTEPDTSTSDAGLVPTPEMMDGGSSASEMGESPEFSVDTVQTNVSPSP